MSRRDEAKKLLKEAGDKHDDLANVRLVAALYSQPDLIARHEPPAGYEDRLLAALRTRTALEKPRVAARRPSIFAGVAALLRAPQLSWSVAGSLAIFAAVLAFNGRFGAPEAPAPAAATDVLASAAVRGGETVVNEWIESVGDSGVRASSGESDLDSVAQSLDELNDPEAIEKALAEVALSVGYNRSKN